MIVTSGSWNPSWGHMLNSGNFSFSVMITGDHHHQSSPSSSSSSPSPCWFKAKAQHHQSWRQPQLLDHPTSAASRTFWLRIMIYNLYKFTLMLFNFFWPTEGHFSRFSVSQASSPSSPSPSSSLLFAMSVSSSLCFRGGLKEIKGQPNLQSKHQLRNVFAK